MSKANHLAVACDAAVKAKANKITYQQQDCQSFIENCVRACGGTMSYAGSNDMYRNACQWIKPIIGGVKPADMEAGHLLFKHAFDNGEPSKYKSDGQGNARHVGLYCGVDGVEVAHSTTTTAKDGAQTAKLSAGWTHYGPAKCMTYNNGANSETVTIEIGSDNMSLAGKNCKVVNGKLNLRATKNAKSTRVCLIPDNASVLVQSDDGIWAQVRYEGADASTGKVGIYNGYCASEYLEAFDINTGYVESNNSELGSGDVISITMPKNAANELLAALYAAFTN